MNLNFANTFLKFIILYILVLLDYIIHFNELVLNILKKKLIIL